MLAMSTSLCAGGQSPCPETINSFGMESLKMAEDNPRTARFCNDQSCEPFRATARVIEVFKNVIRDSGITDAEIEAIMLAHGKSAGTLRFLVDLLDAEGGDDRPARARGEVWEEEPTRPGGDSGGVSSIAQAQG